MCQIHRSPLSIRASSLEAKSFSIMDEMTGLVAMMKNTCNSGECAELVHHLALISNGGFAPLFKHSMIRIIFGTK
jgi:hypothetical protein